MFKKIKLIQKKKNENVLCFSKNIVPIISNRGRTDDNQVENAQIDRKMSTLRLKIPIYERLTIF